jgi:hypothetical protein
MSHLNIFPGYGAADAASALAPLGFTDESYGNDVCPSFVNTARQLAVFVDHVDPGQRECEGQRFTIQQTDECGHVLYSGSYVCTDILSEVIERLARVAGPF